MSKLAPGSIWTKADQLRWYEENVGKDKAAEQIKLANLRDGKCICEPRLMKRKWDGYDRVVQKAVHSRECPKWKKWMEEVS